MPRMTSAQALALSRRSAATANHATDAATFLSLPRCVVLAGGRVVLRCPVPYTYFAAKANRSPYRPTLCTVLEEEEELQSGPLPPLAELRFLEKKNRCRWR